VLAAPASEAAKLDLF